MFRKSNGAAECLTQDARMANRNVAVIMLRFQLLSTKVETRK